MMLSFHIPYENDFKGNSTIILTITICSVSCITSFANTLKKSSTFVSTSGIYMTCLIVNATII